VYSLCFASFCLYGCFLSCICAPLAVRRLIFVCVFVSESACGSVFRILRVFSSVVRGKLPPLFYSFLCYASAVSLDDVPR
jgi:hypothetical protein